MSHVVTLDEDFPDHLERLSSIAQRQVGILLHELEQNPYFLPSEPQFEEYEAQAENNTLVVCRHRTDWGSWQMMWVLLYSSTYTSTVEEVVVSLIEQKAEYQYLYPITPRW